MLPIVSGVNSTPTQVMADVSGTAQLVALWLHGKTKDSQRSYESDVRTFAAFLLAQDPTLVRLNDCDLRTITLNDCQAFADYLEASGMSPATRRRRLAAIKSLLKFGQELGYLRFNVGSKVRLPKRKDTLAERILTELEVMTIIALTTNIRDRTLLKFLYYTGARVGEVARLTWRDIKPNRDGHGQVTLFGKGEETRTVILPDSLYKELLALSYNHNSDAAVFKSQKGGVPLSDRHIRSIVAAAGERAGIKGVSPHWLRHSHASHSLDRGAAPQLVQHTLGHKSLDTTSKYAHAKPNDSSGLYLAR